MPPVADVNMNMNMKAIDRACEFSLVMSKRDTLGMLHSMT